MVKIIPAILVADFKTLEKEVAFVADQSKLVQLDVCDGRFVPSTCWPYTIAANPHHDAYFKKIVTEGDGLPQWQKLDYEIDLMVASPTPAVIDDWVTAGAARIIVHRESVSDEQLSVIIRHLREHFASPSDVKEIGVQLGLAVALDTPLDALAPYLEDIDSVQIMGIERVGFQSQEFAGERVFDKVRAFHSAHPEIPVSVDGGVNLENAKAIIEAGASRLIIGSAIFGNHSAQNAEESFSAASVSAALEKFKEIL